VAGTVTWRASVVVVAVLGLLLTGRVADASRHAGSWHLPFVAALFVLPLLYAVPSGRSVWQRHPRWLLAIQGMLTYVPFALFGSEWVAGMSGLLGGLLLLNVAPPASWLLAGGLLGVEIILWLGIVGPVYEPASHFAIWMVDATLVNAVALFGLARLADLLTEMRRANDDLAAMAVTQERLWVADLLRVAIGDNLAAIAGHGQAALRLLPGARDEAAKRIATAGDIARAAVSNLRAVAARYGDPAGPPSAPAPGPATGIAPRVANVTLILMLAVFCVQHVSNLVLLEVAEAGVVVSLIGSAAIVALQVHHCRPRRADARPLAWGVTLALQALLVYGLVPLVGTISLIFVAFLGGSLLLLLSGQWAWGTYLCAIATVPVILIYDGLTGLKETVYQTTVLAAIALFIYGLARLSDLAGRLAAMGEERTRIAVLQERLRVARDVHDLLGLGLSAAALKSDLVCQLLRRGADDRAYDEVAQLVRVTAAVRDESQIVTDKTRQLALREEIAAARDLLVSVGVEVRVADGSGALPPTVEALFATVLRESVTNVLRHSRSRSCAIVIAVEDGLASLSISNDGVDESPAHEVRRGLGPTPLS
jgi:two-component system sensor histidine kinase DesK